MVVVAVFEAVLLRRDFVRSVLQGTVLREVGFAMAMFSGFLNRIVTPVLAGD
jgi:hypothetical protein